MDAIKTNRGKAKLLFQSSVKQQPDFFGNYHFLGNIFSLEKQPDSAIYYYNKSISLNTGNVNHTAEMTYARLINEYVFIKDFQKAFDIGWKAYQAYPESGIILSPFKDACLWSYYLKYDKLDPSYLSTDPKQEYVVNSIPQEYLIVRKIRIDDEPLSVAGQRLQVKGKDAYDVLTCTAGSTKDKKDISFKINWDMNKYFGGKPPESSPGQSAPIYEKVGKLLADDSKADLKVEIPKLQ